MEISNEYKIWARRLSFYLAIYIAVILISRAVFFNFNLLHTDVDSARYMLSALIQSEAAIIAIVITMSLVAAQLAASSYSVRVTNIFRNSPDLWILMLIYGIVLFWGLGVLKLIEKADPQCTSDLICQSNLQGHIALTYSLGIFAFVALAPYLWNIFGMLNASTITTNCAKYITKESILKSITKKKPTDNDSFLTIIDIIKSSLVKYDYGTLETGLRAIEERIGIILNDGSFNIDDESEISEYVFGHLALVGKLALSKNDEYSIIQVTNAIQEIGSIAVENQREYVAYEALDVLKTIGIDAAVRKLKWPILSVIKAIQKIAEISVDTKFKIHTIEAGLSEVSCLKEIGMVTIDNKLERHAHSVASSLVVIGMRGRKDENYEIHGVIDALKIMGKSATEKGLLELTQKIAELSASIPSECMCKKCVHRRGLDDAADIENAST